MSIIKNMQEYYNDWVLARHNNIEAAAYAADNKKNVPIVTFPMDLTSARTPNATPYASMVVKKGRFNRIFLIDYAPTGVLATVLVKVYDSQNNSELFPLVAGGLLKAENGILWTKAEFYNTAISKSILIGLGMDVSFQQPLVSIAGGGDANNVAVPYVLNTGLAGVDTIVSVDLTATCKNRFDTMQNVSGGTIKIRYTSTSLDEGIPILDQGYFYNDSLCPLYAIRAGGTLSVATISTKRLL